VIGLSAIAGLAGVVVCVRGLRERARLGKAKKLLGAGGEGNGPSGDWVVAARAQRPGPQGRRVASPAMARATVALGVVVGLLSLFGVIIAFDRTVDTVAVLGGQALPDDAFERGLASRPFLTLLHVVPGLLFMALGPFQFVKKIRSRHIRLHRWCGRVWVVSAVAAGVTALIMGIVLGYGGPNETVAVTFFSLLFLAFVGKGFLHVWRREIPLHREWMIRAFAAGLAISSMRPIQVFFFTLTDMPFQAFFGTTFWLAFSLHLLVAEVWINSTRPAPAKAGKPAVAVKVLVPDGPVPLPGP
jgi:uncharacterized membrane protein